MKFFKNILVTLSGKGIYVVCGLVSGMITARWLGPHDRGVLAIVMAIPATVWMFTNFGINQANVYYLGKRKYSLSAVVSNTLVLSLSSGIIITLFLWITKDFFALKLIKAVDPLYLLLAIISIPVLVLKNSYGGILRSLEKFVFMNLIQSSRSLLGLAVVVCVLVYLEKGLIALLIVIIFLNHLEAFFTLLRVNVISRFKFAFNISLSKDVFRFGIKSYFQNMIGFLHNRIDLFMIAYFLVPAQIAFYDISVIVGEMLFFLPQSITFVILPKLVKLNDEEKAQVVAQTGRIAFALTVVLSVGLVLFGERLIELVYGKNYGEAFLPLCFMLPGLILSCSNSVIVPYYTSRHKQKVTIVVSIISLISNIILNFYMIPLYGIIGAAISTSITYSLFSLVLLSLFYYENNIHLKDMIIVQSKDILLLRNYLIKRKPC